MGEIVRTGNDCLRPLNAEEKAKTSLHVGKWIEMALSTAPLEAECMVSAIKTLYALIGLGDPQVVVVPSPKVLALAGGCAAAISWSRDNPAQARLDGLIGSRGGDLNARASAAHSRAVDAIDKSTKLAFYRTLADVVRDTPESDPVAHTVAKIDFDMAAHRYRRSAVPLHGQTRAAVNQVAETAWSVLRHCAPHYVAGFTCPVVDQTLPATYSAVHAALGAHIGTGRVPLPEATHAVSFAALARRLGDEFGIDPLFLLACSRRWPEATEMALEYSHRVVPFTAFRDVLGLAVSQAEAPRACEACAAATGYYFLHQKFCIVSDRPEIVTVDAQQRPHNNSGPSHRWRDGSCLYHWHGVRIPPEKVFVIESPQTIDVAVVEAETNVEVRRVMLERYGAARYVHESGAVVVQQLPADHPVAGLRTARLLRKDVRDDEPIVYVDLLNSTSEPDGTVKRYLLRVSPHAYDGEAARNAHAAAASTWRNADGSLAYKDWRDYRPDAES